MSFALARDREGADNQARIDISDEAAVVAKQSIARLRLDRPERRAAGRSASSNSGWRRASAARRVSGCGAVLTADSSATVRATAGDQDCGKHRRPDEAEQAAVPVDRQPCPGRAPHADGRVGGDRHEQDAGDQRRDSYERPRSGSLPNSSALMAITPQKSTTTER